MKWLLFPFFLFRLGLALLPFLLELFWLKITPYKISLLLSLFFFLHLLMLGTTIFQLNQRIFPPSPTLSNSENETINRVQKTLSEQPQHRKIFIADPQLDTLQSSLETQLQLAPTHRDLLLNLAILSAFREPTTPHKTTSLLEQAQSSDPNSWLFQ